MSGTKTLDSPQKAIRDLQRRVARIERRRAFTNGLAAVVWQGTPQAIANATDVPMNMDTVETDPDGMWSVANPARVTVPIAGWYLLTAEVGFVANATGIRHLTLEINGATNVAHHQENAAAGGVATHLPIMRIRYMNPTDFLRVIARQTSTVSLNTTATQDTVWMGVAFLGQ